MNRGEKVLVVATFAEARELGARQSRGVLRMPDRSWVISVAAGPAAIEGLRISEARYTEKALRAPGIIRIQDMIARSIAKIGGPR